MRTGSSMRDFDPRKVAHLEKEAWVAYYQKRWFRLLQVIIDLVQKDEMVPEGAVVVTSGGIGANHDLVRASWPAIPGSDTSCSL